MASITILSEESRQNAAPDPKKDERLLPKLIEKFAAEDPDFIIGMNAVLPETPNAPLQYDELTVSRLDNAINYMAYWIEQSIQKLHLSSNEPIGYSGLQDLRYLVLEIAAIKIGRPILLPSPRNAVVNTISLLRETGCRVVFYSGDLGVQESELKNSIPELTMLEVPLLSQMTNSETPHYPYTKTWEQAKDDVVMIIHTSGSTGVPKPICHNNSVIRRLDIESEIPTIPGRVNASTSLCEPGKAVLCGTNLYHLSGICFTLMALFNRYTIVFGPADGLPSGEVMYEMIKSMKFAGLVMVPSLLDHLISKHGEEIEGFLGELEHVNWLGGTSPPLPLNPEY
ncbi:hypothetical protein M7I_1190 [Glarea lozoyensis 74030]|uniref:AMP-dependent synthetase/ligase domain-containing protein n=1 Tax=Glarea lozoyensis (strain ATCC 74030 / MF5533) TaxID=1104152 RepID=H0EFB8_GLAL7|nr:hypothetical protein M7I_1190 [Glarea lozoyensis 74030]